MGVRIDKRINRIIPIRGNDDIGNSCDIHGAVSMKRYNMWETVYDHLTDEDAKTYGKTLKFLPEVLKEETLEGIAVGRMGSLSGLLIATDNRITFMTDSWSGVSSKTTLYDEIDVMGYSTDRKIKGKKKNGLIRSFEIDLSSGGARSDKFVSILQELFPLANKRHQFEMQRQDEQRLARERERYRQNVLSILEK